MSKTSAFILVSFWIAIGLMIGYGLFKPNYEPYLCRKDSNFSQYECSKIIRDKKCEDVGGIAVELNNEVAHTCMHNTEKLYEIRNLHIKEN